MPLVNKIKVQIKSYIENRYQWKVGLAKALVDLAVPNFLNTYQHVLDSF